MSEENCIILAGGLGTRLRSVLQGKPKCLAPVRGRPFLELQLLSLKCRGFRHFILSIGHLAEQVLDCVDVLRGQFNIECIVEKKPLGTGGAIAFAMNELSIEESVVVNGDTFVGGSLQNLHTPLRADQREFVRMGIAKVSNRARYGGVDVNKNGLICDFTEKGDSSPGFINAGIYRVNSNIFSSQNDISFSFENDVLPQLVEASNVTCCTLAGPFIDIGEPEYYEQFSLIYSESLSSE